MSIVSFNEAVSVAEMQSGVRQSVDGLTATFYHKPIQDKLESEAQGRPVFAEHDYIKILIPHDNKSVIDRKVKDEDKRRWPQAWAAYEAGEQGVMGVPLKEWNYLTTSRRMELEAMNFRTVEELAHMADAHMGKLGPDGRKLCDRARQFLEGSDKNTVELTKKIQARDETISNLTADMEILRRQVDEMRRGVSPRQDKRTKEYRDANKEG